MIYAPGFNSDERDLDPVLSQSSRDRLHATRLPDSNVLSFVTAFARGAVHADFGRSRDLEVPVRDLIADRGPISARILFLGVIISWIIGLIWASSLVFFRSPALLTVSGSLNTLNLCLPTAVLAVIGWSAGWPAELILAIVLLPKIVQVSRSLIVNALEAPDIVCARSRGVRLTRILGVYVLPKVASPMLAWVAATVSMAIGALIPLEVICDIPGIGQLAWKSALSRDGPVLFVLTVMVSLVLRTSNMFSTTVARPARG